MLYARHLWLWFEPTLLIVLVLLIALRPAPLAAVGRWFVGGALRLRRRPRMAMGALAALTLLGAATVMLLAGAPVPRVQDEFCHVLAADTFARGRLANAPDAHWPHFESFHLLQQPTYASKYPPAQGWLLASGAVVGQPALALVAGAALTAMVFLWALRAWLPLPWAFVGAVAVTLRWGVASYWTHSYWGGLVPALGGALLWGGVKRALDPVDDAGEAGALRPRVIDAALLALGLILLANSRPFGGLVLSLPAAAWMGWRLLVVRRPAPRVALGRIVVPVTLVLALGGAWMLRYNAAVTGDPWTLPQIAYERQYAMIPLFRGQAERAIDYRHDVMRDFYQHLIDTYDPDQRVIAPGEAAQRLGALVDFLLGPALVLALLAAARRGRDGEDRLGWTWLAVAVFIAGQLYVKSWWPHYAAPVALPLILLATVGLRRIWRWRIGARAGRPGRALVAAALLLQLAQLGPQLHERLRERDFWSHTRHAIATELAADGGRHLVFVRYGAAHHPAREWVYNGAALDEEIVLWARAMDPAADRALIAAKPDRRAWRVDVGVPGTDGPRLAPYDP
ncbi:MAG: hypothetical protein AAF772_14765 [Acidobacteriota bacterium]